MIFFACGRAPAPLDLPADSGRAFVLNADLEPELKEANLLIDSLAVATGEPVADWIATANVYVYRTTAKRWVCAREGAWDGCAQWREAERVAVVTIRAEEGDCLADTAFLHEMAHVWKCAEGNCDHDHTDPKLWPFVTGQIDGAIRRAKKLGACQ